MNLEEYKERMEEDQKWLPGLDEIDKAFNKIYCDMECTQYGNIMYDKDKINNYELYGVSIYESKNGYKHLVTHGMSEIYANEEHFGKINSGWGYEMTIKIDEDADEECTWAIDILRNLSLYTYINKTPLESMQYIKKEGCALYKGNNFNIEGIIIVNDTEVQGIDTVHGRVEFLQIFGITREEVKKIEKGNLKAEEIIENIKKKNPHLVLHKDRKESYI